MLLLPIGGKTDNIVGQAHESQQIEFAPLVGSGSDRATLVAFADFKMIATRGHPVAAFDLQPQAPPTGPDHAVVGSMFAQARKGYTDARENTVDEEFACEAELFCTVAKNITRQIGVSHHLMRGSLSFRGDIRRVEPGQARLLEHFRPPCLV